MRASRSLHGRRGARNVEIASWRWVAHGVAARVVVRFVVDTTARIEVDSERVVSSDHPDFTAAVRAVLPRLRFVPAESGGRPVRMLVELPFEFALR